MADEERPVDGDGEEEAEPTPPKRRSRLLLIAAPMLVVGMLGAGYLWWVPSEGDVEAAEAEEGPAAPQGLVTLAPFTVNLTDGSGNRFLRVTIELAVPTADEGVTITTDPVRLATVRSNVLEVLTMQRAEELATPEGKTALKAALTEAIAPAIAPTRVSDVLFTEFVIQF